MNVLLAGGAGFLGKNLAALWTDLFPDDKVLVVDTLRRHRPDVGVLERLGDILVVQGDVADTNLVVQLLEAHAVDLVVNLTCVASVERAAADPPSAVRSNVTTAVSLLEGCRRVGGVRLHQVSSAEVFGASTSVASASEHVPYSPWTVYGASKAAADHFVRAYHQCHGVPVTISLAPNTYGPFQPLDQVVPRFVTNAILGRPLPVYGTGQHLREWLHVTDHCAGIATVARFGRPGASYSLASGVLVPVASLAATVLELLGRPASLVTWLPERPGNHDRPALDAATALGELGWHTTVAFDEGLRRTVDWYLDNRRWWMPIVEPSARTSTPRRRAS